MMTFDFDSIKHLKKFKEGNQGSVGLVEDKNGNICVYKIAQDLNFLAEHEYNIMRGLNEIHDFCPFFCKPVGCKRMYINVFHRERDEDPFSKSADKYVELPVVFLEYIEDAIPFSKLIEDQDIEFGTILSIIKQVIIAFMIAYKERGFVHYDLHPENVLVRKCESNQLNVYRLDSSNVVSIPTMGYSPIIIDYGFSASRDLYGKPLCCLLEFSSSGYFAPLIDPLADIKRFLVAVSTDIRCERFGETPYEFRNVVKNLFIKLDIDWGPGWDLTEEENVTDEIFDYLIKEGESSMWDNRRYSAIASFHYLLTVPARGDGTVGNYNLLLKGFECFMKEFSKIEEELSDNHYFSAYALHHLVQIAREKRDDFDVNPEKCAREISNYMFDKIRKTVSFCRFKKVDWKLMLCALYLIQEQLSIKFSGMASRRLESKFKQYRELEYNSTPQIFGLIDLLFPIEFSGNAETNVLLFDAVNRESDEYLLNESEWEKINSMENVLRGMEIWEIL